MKAQTKPHVKPIAVPGSTVAVVSLSAPEPSMNKELFEAGLNWLRSRGLRVKTAPSVTDSRGFLSNTPAILAKELALALEDPEVDWIASAGGGANANRLLPYLPFQEFRSHCKPLVGMSNVSLLLNALTHKTGVPTFHGPAVLWNLGNGVDDFTEKGMWQALTANSNYHASFGSEVQWLRGGKASGHLYGGNLWSLQQLIGTPWQPDLKDCILFIEDCFCQVHQIDAIFAHFQQSRILDGIAGLIVGVMEGVEEQDYKPAPTVGEIILENCRNGGFPIVAGVFCGHSDTKMTLPIGRRVDLNEDSKGLTVYV